MNKLEIQNNRAPYLFRYRSDNKNTIDELERNYIYFPNSEKLNDPFDANSDMLEFSRNPIEYQKLYEMLLSQIPNVSKEYFIKDFKNKPDKLYEFVNKMKEDFISQFGIACFTMSEINLPLWSSYANNHQGLCIQYNIDFDHVFFKGLRKIDYFKKFEKIKYSPATDSGGFQEILFKKFYLWKKWCGRWAVLWRMAESLQSEHQVMKHGVGRTEITLLVKSCSMQK